MSYQSQSQIEVSPGQMVEHLVQFDGPPDQFLLELLAVQCRVGNAEHGAILRQGGGEGQGIEVLSIYPPMREGATAPIWLSQAAELAPIVMDSKKPRTAPIHSPGELYGMAPSRYLVLLPIWGKASVRGVAGFVVPNGNPIEVEQSRRQLELTISLLSLYELRLTLQRRKSDLARFKTSCEVLNTLNEQPKYLAAAMALCNQVASAWKAERVGLGLLKGRYVKLQAMSHTEKFTRKMELVQAIESAMEECLDQDVEIVYPAAPQSTTINRAAKELSGRAGGTIVLSLPLRRNGEPVGVLTIERPPDQPFDLEEVEALRVTCDLCTARVTEMEARDRWFGAKIAASGKSALAVLVGPHHTWAKATGLGVFAFLLFATFVDGTYRVSTPFLVEATQLQTLSAPYDGFLLRSSMRPGDPVVAGETTLAELDTSEWLIQLKNAQAEEKSFATEAEVALGDNKIGEAEVSRAKARQSAAQVEELQWKISQGRVKSPLSGRVLTGDLSKQIGSPVRQGQILFEVAPDELRAELAVPEGDVADLKEGQTGLLSSVSMPGRYVPFVVEQIEPVAEVVDQRNVFRVRIQLEEPPPWLRPGMEGVAKVDVDERPYILIWTRDFVNWVRMKLWI